MKLFTKVFLLIVVGAMSLYPQGRGGRGAAPVPQTAKAAAPMNFIR